MKKWIVWALVLSLLLCGCGGKTADVVEQEPAALQSAEQTPAETVEVVETTEATEETKPKWPPYKPSKPKPQPQPPRCG